MPSSRRRGRFSARKRSRPGLARPIEFSIPASVSAMRTGGFPRGKRGDGFETNASRERATSGAVSASRHPEALRSLKPMPAPGRLEDRSLDAQSLQLAVDLDRTSIARSVSAGHRRLPGELCVGLEGPHRLEHRLGAAGQDVVLPMGNASVTYVGSITTSAFGTSAAASACHALLKPSSAGGGPAPRTGTGTVRCRSHPRPGAGCDVESIAVAERAVDGDPAAGRARQARACRARSGRSGTRARLAARSTGSSAAEGCLRRLQHEELARDPRLEASTLEPKQGVRPNGSTPER